jgi:hypothetical protein
MKRTPPHLFVDISSHGFGHLAQAAPVLNALARRLPELKLTVRSGLSEARLRSRLSCRFAHLAARSDFGYVMHDAVAIDHAASAAAYRAAHAGWRTRVEDERAWLSRLAPDLVLTDVAYLPLAGAAAAKIPALAMSSLNWADLFAHFYGAEPWATEIHREMFDAYASAETFLRLTPAMTMASLPRTRAIAPVAALGRDRRGELRDRIACSHGERVVLVAFGGVEKDYGAHAWPQSTGVRWLVPQRWRLARTDMHALEATGLPFTDLLRSVDAVLTKPGYGTFTEAACNGTPVLFARRDDWPEQDCLIDWLKANARCAEIGADAVASGQMHEALAALWQQAQRPLPHAGGAEQAAALIAEKLTVESRNV